MAVASPRSPRHRGAHPCPLRSSRPSGRRVQGQYPASRLPRSTSICQACVLLLWEPQFWQARGAKLPTVRHRVPGNYRDHWLVAQEGSRSSVDSNSCSTLSQRARPAAPAVSVRPPTGSRPSLPTPAIGGPRSTSYYLSRQSQRPLGRRSPADRARSQRAPAAPITESGMRYQSTLIRAQLAPFWSRLSAYLRCPLTNRGAGIPP